MKITKQAYTLEFKELAVKRVKDATDLGFTKRARDSVFYIIYIMRSFDST